MIRNRSPGPPRIGTTITGSRPALPFRPPTQPPKARKTEQRRRSTCGQRSIVSSPTCTTSSYKLLQTLINGVFAYLYHVIASDSAGCINWLLPDEEGDAGLACVRSGQRKVFKGVSSDEEFRVVIRTSDRCNHCLLRQVHSIVRISWRDGQACL